MWVSISRSWIRGEFLCDPALVAYGWALLCGHAVILAYFFDTNVLFVLLASAEPVCWPFFETCWQYRFENPVWLELVLAGYSLLVLAAVGALTIGRQGAFGILLLLANLVMLGLVGSDYRIRGNQFYMFGWLNAVYLFWPNKRWALPVLIISFYFWAGILKLNWEWLSGSVLYHDLWLIPNELAWLACTYVVILETTLTWGLVAARRTVVYVVLAQLGLFHLESFSQIHWFYPVLMATVLAWFVIERTFGTPSAQISWLVRGRAPASVYLLLGMFSLLQILPYVQSTDPSLTGQARVVALHMFEARQRCDVSATLLYENGTRQQADLKMGSLPERLICDPVVYFSRAQNICRSRSARGLTDLELTMRVGRSTDESLQTIIDESAFCSGEHTYSVFGTNKWLRSRW